MFWEDPDLHAEIQGAQHYEGLGVVDDSLWFNHLALQDRQLTSLQVPVLGLRLRPDVFFAQIRQAMARWEGSRAG